MAITCNLSTGTLAHPVKSCNNVAHWIRFRAPLIFHINQQCLSRGRRQRRRTRIEASTIWTAISQLKGGSQSIVNFIEHADPLYYLVYMFAAGLGFPCSEDAFVIWVGSKLWRGVYGAWQQAAYVLFIVYVGVVVSDLLTFCIGLALRQGLLKPLKDKLLPKNSASITKAEEKVTKWSKYIGAVQRFSVGFRGPLCLLSGFTGVPATQFAVGASLGALGTMPIQLTIGYLMRNAPNVYLSSLALVAVPNIIGNYLGPLTLGLVTAFRMNRKGRQSNGDGHNQLDKEG